MRVGRVHESRVPVDRIRNEFKIEKARMYRDLGGRDPQPEGINDVFLYLANKYEMKVREVKNIVNPAGYTN